MQLLVKNSNEIYFYLYSNVLGEVLADILTECAMIKPKNPYLFVAEALYK